MKKILYILALVAFMGISANTFAQTGIAPEIGSDHTYTVANHTGNAYAWFVTADEKEGAAADLIGSGPGAIVTGTSATNSIVLTWVNPVVGTTYYLHVVETASVANGGCTNHKVLAITPVNGFNLEIIAVAEATPNNALAIDYSVCADDVSVSDYNGSLPAANLIDAQDFTYVYGTNTFYYRIKASGIGSNGWSPQFTIARTDGAAIYDAEWATAIGGPYSTVDLATNGDVNDIDVDPGNSFIWVKVVVTNAEGVNNNPVVVTLLDTADTSEDANGNDVKTITTPTSTQTIKGRPNTGGISAS